MKSFFPGPRRACVRERSSENPTSHQSTACALPAASTHEATGVVSSPKGAQGYPHPWPQIPHLQKPSDSVQTTGPCRGRPPLVLEPELLGWKELHVLVYQVYGWLEIPGPVNVTSLESNRVFMRVVKVR